MPCSRACMAADARRTPQHHRNTHIAPQHILYMRVCICEHVQRSARNRTSTYDVKPVNYIIRVNKLVATAAPPPPPSPPPSSSSPMHIVARNALRSHAIRHVLACSHAGARIPGRISLRSAPRTPRTYMVPRRARSIQSRVVICARTPHLL